MFFKITTACIAFFATTSSIFAYDFDKALKNVSEEFAFCAAYYTVIEKFALATDNRALQESSNEASKTLLYFSTLSSNEKLALANYKQVLDSYNKRIESAKLTVPILQKQMSNLCIESNKKPFARLEFWLNLKE